jgi:crotonobetainyl-CoA:carnitine CoA-transferase CaiB-like acyl-CoA transferase
MTRNATMTAPLQGFRVMDRPSVISGPLGTMLLADQGADVIKVKRPAAIIPAPPPTAGASSRRRS